MTEEHFFEIGETSIVHDSPTGRKTTDTALSEKDGMIVARVAGTENIAYIIKIIDPDTIQTQFFMYGSPILKRSNAAAREAGLKKNKEAVEAASAPLEWKSNGFEGFMLNSNMLLKDHRPFGVVRDDGTVTTVYRDEKTGNYEVVGHISDFVSQLNPDYIVHMDPKFRKYLTPEQDQKYAKERGL